MLENIDYELDLHDCTIDEAMAKVEQEITALSQAGYKTLRVIHGNSSRGVNTIKSQLRINLNSRWKKWVDGYKSDLFNQGITIIMLKRSKKS